MFPEEIIEYYDLFIKLSSTISTFQSRYSIQPMQFFPVHLLMKNSIVWFSDYASTGEN